MSAEQPPENSQEYDEKSMCSNNSQPVGTHLQGQGKISRDAVQKQNQNRAILFFRCFFLSVLTSFAPGLVLTIIFEIIRIKVGYIYGSLSDQIHHFSNLSFFLNVSIFALFILFVRALTNRVSIAVIVASAAWGLFYFSHVQKYKILGKPLVLSDLSLLKELINVSQTVVAGHIYLAVIVCVSAILIISAVILLLFRKTMFSMAPAARILLGTLAVSPFISEPFLHWQYNFTKSINIKNNDHNYPVNLRNNGFALTLLLMNMRDTVEKPKNYNARILAEALNQFKMPLLKKTQGEGHAGDERPDVIVYMGEAFWDITQLPDIQYSTDPMANFHKIASNPNTRQLTMTSPSFGGATANVEFEVLTGFSTAFFPISSIPYTQFIRHSVENTVPDIFQKNNYYTLAMHNFHGFFFSRTTVYPLIGFDNFICLEQLKNVDLQGRPAPQKRENNRGIDYWSTAPVFIDGKYTSDEPLAYRLIQELDSNSRQPKFIYAIGMVGHGPYLFERWPSPDVTVSFKTKESAPSETTLHELENLANAVFRTDKAVGWIFDQLQKRKKKTIFIVFGDHLPGISRESYTAAGFDEGKMRHKSYEVKVLMWANYPLPEIASRDAFSAFYLGPKILRAAGLELPPKMALIENAEHSIPTLSPALFRFPNGEWTSAPSDYQSIDPEQRHFLELLQSMAYEEFRR